MPYETILLGEFQNFYPEILREIYVCNYCTYLVNSASYSIHSLQTVKMSTCKSQCNKCWNYCFAQIIWVTHSWLSALDLLCIATQQSMHEQWLQPHCTTSAHCGHGYSALSCPRDPWDSWQWKWKDLIYCPNKKHWKSAPPTILSGKERH